MTVVGCLTKQPVTPWLTLIRLVAVLQQCIIATGGVHGMHIAMLVSDVSDYFLVSGKVLKNFVVTQDIAERKLVQLLPETNGRLSKCYYFPG